MADTINYGTTPNREGKDRYFNTVAELPPAGEFGPGLGIIGEPPSLKVSNGIAWSQISVLQVPTLADLPPASEFSGVAQAADDMYESNGKIYGRVKSFKTQSRPRANLLNYKDYSYMTLFGITGGTASVDAITGVLNLAVPAGVPARAYCVFSAPGVLLANNLYAMSFRVLEKTGSFSSDITCIQENPAAGTVNQETTKLFKFSELIPGKKYFTLFRPDVSGAMSQRIGLGVGAVVTALTDATLVVDSVAIENLSASGYAYPALYNLPPLQSVNVIDSSAAVVVGNTISGDIITTQNNSIAFFGDSYSNDGTDYPAQFKTLATDWGVWIQWEVSAGVTTAGKKLVEFLVNFESKMQALIDFGVAPRFVFIQSSLNTMNDSSSITRPARIAADYARLVECIEWSKSKNIIPILTTVSPWRLGADAYWYSAGVYRDQQKWDDGIYALASQHALPVFNLRSVLAEPTDPYAMLAEYDSGDHMHPNVDGYIAIATELYSMVKGL